MIDLDIQEEDGFLVMKDFPENCIFNKVKTGCGATTIALTNNENYIIAVPTTELIVNKCFPTDEGQTWKKRDKKAGLSPAKNLFGLYDKSTLTLKGKLKAYLSENGTKKIICTYDKIPYLMRFINPKEFKLLVDEYHHFLKSYSFRDKAIDGILKHFKEFKSYCFMSATPIPTDFKPDALNGIPEFKAKWKNLEAISVLPYKTDKPYMIAAKIIKAYQEDGYIEVDGIKSYEAFFFVNSVTEIKQILQQAELTDDNCRIICADKPKNAKTLAGYTISSSTDISKKFNFITSKSFEGVDYFSETGLCFVVSNILNKHTLVSIDMDIPQIAGRIRTKTNPFKNKLIHIFNTKLTDSFSTYEDMKQEVEKQLTYAQERADSSNNNERLSDGAKQQQKSDIENLKKQSYLKYDNEGKKFVVNDMVGKLQLYAYMITNEIYSSGKKLKAEYSKIGISTSDIKWELAPDDYVKKLISKPTFRDYLKSYCEIMERNPLTMGGERDKIEKKYPFLVPAYHILGLKELKRQRTIKAIKVALKDKS
jgi:hypothetical protein